MQYANLKRLEQNIGLLFTDTHYIVPAFFIQLCIASLRFFFVFFYHIKDDEGSIDGCELYALIKDILEANGQVRSC